MKKQRKILVITNAYPSSDKKYAGIFVKNQYNTLLNLKDDFESIDLFYMPRRITSFIGSIQKYLRFALKLVPYFFKRYDIVHLHFFYPLITVVYIYKIIYPSTKLIVTFHGSDINIKVNAHNQKFYRLLAQKIDVAIPVGQTVKENIQNKLGITTHSVLPVGIDRDIFYEIPHKEKIYDLLYVGSFLKVKGFDILFSLIKRLNQDISICIVGKGEIYEKKINELINLGYTNITLKIDQNQIQLRNLYNESKFLILLSRSEGFPTVTLESMYCGTPVITSDIPQFKEQVVNNFNGYIVNTCSIDDLLRNVTEFLSISKDKYIALSEGALNSHREYNLENICRQLLELYRC